MKKWLAATLLVLFTTNASAQVNEKFADFNDEIEMLRALTRVERQQVVTDSMKLSPQESTKFWPLYREYQAELTQVNDRVVKIITDFGASYGSMTDARAQTLLDDFLALQSETIALRKRYVSRFSKVLPMTKVARFYQIENKLDTIANLTFVEQVPLAQ